MKNSTRSDYWIAAAKVIGIVPNYLISVRFTRSRFLRRSTLYIRGSTRRVARGSCRRLLAQRDEKCLASRQFSGPGRAKSPAIPPVDRPRSRRGGMIVYREISALMRSVNARFSVQAWRNIRARSSSFPSSFSSSSPVPLLIRVETGRFNE